MEELVRLLCRIVVGVAVYVAIVLLAALLPAAAGLMLTFPALNGLGFLFSEDERANSIAKTMFWMPIVNGTLSIGYILLYVVLARNISPSAVAWSLLLVIAGFWFAWVSRRPVRTGIDRHRQLGCAIAATAAGTVLAAVTVLAANRFGVLPQHSVLAPPTADNTGSLEWIAVVIAQSRLKIVLFALALAVFAVAIEYWRISDAARGILSGLPIVTFGGLLAVGTGSAFDADARLRIFIGMAAGAWLGPAIAMWFIYAIAGLFGSRRKLEVPAVDALARFGVLVLGWLATLMAIVAIALLLR